jgi:Xaa-Pro dipeptidase
MTARAEAELARALPDATFHDADLLVNWVRAVKSDAEVAMIRQAATIAERGMRAGIAAIAAGVRQCDVAAELYRALISGTEEYGGEAPNYLSMPTGERASAPHLTWTDEPFRPGEATNIELGGNRHHYNAGLARTVCIAPAPPKLAALAPVVAEGMAAALAAAVPGALAQDVEAAWRAVITRAGYEKASRIGYSIGIGFPGLSWGERTISLRAGDRTVLQPNMTFHMILGMWMDDWGFELSEVLRIRERGEPETFSNLERVLFVND